MAPDAEVALVLLEVKVVEEPKYNVVWPLGKLASPELDLPSRVSDLKGKTVAELSDYLFKAEKIFPFIRKAMRERYPGIKFVEFDIFGNIHGAREAEKIAALPRLLHEYGCDVVISGVGA